MSANEADPVGSRPIEKAREIAQGDRTIIAASQQSADRSGRDMFPCEHLSYLNGVKIANFWTLAHALREEFFESSLFADPAWDILLELYRAGYHKEKVKITSLSASARVPSSTSGRWVRNLTRKGLVIQERDPKDKRRVYVHLSAEGHELMRRYFDVLIRRGESIIDFWSAR